MLPVADPREEGRPEDEQAEQDALRGEGDAAAAAEDYARYEAERNEDHGSYGPEGDE